MKAAEMKAAEAKPPETPHRKKRDRRAAEARRVRAPESLDRALATFEQAVGGRAALVSALQHAISTDDDEFVVGMIADPRNDLRSLGTICRQGNVKFTAILRLFRDAGFVKAQLEAFQRVWALLPEVAGDIAARSIPHYVVCSGCGGDKVVLVKEKQEQENGREIEVEIERPCPFCRGAGEILKEPDFERQKLTLEIGRMLPAKGAGVQVGVQVNAQQQVGIFGADVLKEFRASSDRLLYPGRRREVVEAQ